MTESPRERFNRLADDWESKSMNLSTARGDRESFQALVDMGTEAVPFIVERLKSRKPSWLIFPLHHILGTGPQIPLNMRGNLHEMVKLWLAWIAANPTCKLPAMENPQ